MSDSHEAKLIEKAKDKILSMGYTVYLPKDSTYLFYTDGKSVGYVQAERLFRTLVSLSSETKPTSNLGTGKVICKEISIDEMDERALKETLEASANAEYPWNSPDEWFESFFKKEHTEILHPDKKANIESAITSDKEMPATASAPSL